MAQGTNVPPVAAMKQRVLVDNVEALISQVQAAQAASLHSGTAAAAQR